MQVRSLILGLSLFSPSAVLVGLFDVANAELSSIMRVPTTKLALGSGLEEIIQAAERCAIESGSPCTIEEYTGELSESSIITVPSFLMDQTEVPIENYQRCVAEGSCRPARYDRTVDGLFAAQLPVVLVSQVDAANYCKFVGARLPTEAEFEVAAAGSSRRQYPWGTLFHTSMANFGSRRAPYSDTRDGYELLAPVRAFQLGASTQGVLQLAGNVAEWTSTPFASHSERNNPSATTSLHVVVKGGSFRTLPVDQRAHARRAMTPQQVAVDVGFRCVRSAQPTPSVVKKTN